MEGEGVRTRWGHRTRWGRAKGRRRTGQGEEARAGGRGKGAGTGHPGLLRCSGVAARVGAGAWLWQSSGLPWPSPSTEAPQAVPAQGLAVPSLPDSLGYGTTHRSGCRPRASGESEARWRLAAVPSWTGPWHSGHPVASTPTWSGSMCSTEQYVIAAVVTHVTDTTALGYTQTHVADT